MAGRNALDLVRESYRNLRSFLDEWPDVFFVRGAFLNLRRKPYKRHDDDADSPSDLEGEDLDDFGDSSGEDIISGDDSGGDDAGGYPIAVEGLAGFGRVDERGARGTIDRYFLLLELW